jgi:HSP20 family protein
MERVFDDFFRDFRDIAAINPSSLLQGVNFPSIDMYEEKDKFVVKAEVPGMDKEEIHISVVDHTLQLRGEVRKEEAKDERDYHYNERVYGTFFREIPLPSAVNTDQIRASFKNGVLTIEIPKSKEAGGKEIKIESK